jgi:RNA 3'-terminal phosphate cyclase (ATP)
VIREELGWRREDCAVESITTSPGLGNVLICEVRRDDVTEVFTGFGEKGVRAEQVARHVVDEIRAYLTADVPVGVHLADQLLLPMALGAGGVFRTQPMSLHARTNLEIIERFVAADIAVREDERSATVTVTPAQ